MYDLVKAAMLKWPDVPDVEGWLRLDREGRWHHKTAGRVTRADILEFIIRNYERDGDSGRWYFQNGPQRVWVACESTPLVIVVLSEEADGWHAITHTGQSIALDACRLTMNDDGYVRVQSEQWLDAIEVAPSVLVTLRDRLEETPNGFRLQGESSSLSIVSA